MIFRRNKKEKHKHYMKTYEDMFMLKEARVSVRVQLCDKCEHINVDNRYVSASYSPEFVEDDDVYEKIRQVIIELKEQKTKNQNINNLKNIITGTWNYEVRKLELKELNDEYQDAERRKTFSTNCCTISYKTSSDRNEKWNIVHELLLTGKNAKIFADEIGFYLPRKQNLLLSAFDSKSRIHSTGDTIPDIKDDKWNEPHTKVSPDAKDVEWNYLHDKPQEVVDKEITEFVMEVNSVSGRKCSDTDPHSHYIIDENIDPNNNSCMTKSELKELHEEKERIKIEHEYNMIKNTTNATKCNGGQVHTHINNADVDPDNDKCYNYADYANEKYNINVEKLPEDDANKFPSISNGNCNLNGGHYHVDNITYAFNESCLTHEHFVEKFMSDY